MLSNDNSYIQWLCNGYCCYFLVGRMDYFVKDRQFMMKTCLQRGF